MSKRLSQFQNLVWHVKKLPWEVILNLPDFWRFYLKKKKKKEEEKEKKTHR